MYINNKLVIQKVFLLVRSNKIKEDFKVKAFFNVPEYLSLLKKCNLSLSQLLDQIDKLLYNFYPNSLLKVSIFFTDTKDLIIINNGFLNSNLLKNLAVINGSFLLLVYSDLILILYLQLKFSKKKSLIKKLNLNLLKKKIQNLLSIILSFEIKFKVCQN